MFCKCFVLADILLVHGDKLNLNFSEFASPLFLRFHVIFLTRRKCRQYFLFLFPSFTLYPKVVPLIYTKM